MRDHDVIGRVSFNLSFPAGLPAGRWLRIRYHMTLYGSGARPTLRLRTGSGDRWIAMSAALFGSAEWIGHIPVDILDLCIALPPGLEGKDFRLVSCDVLSRWSLLLMATRHAPQAALHAVALRLTGPAAGVRTYMEELIATTRLDRYDQWRRRNSRALDERGLEAARETWSGGPLIRVVVAASAGIRPDDLSATIDSLCRQSYPHWSVVCVCEGMVPPAGPTVAAKTLCVGSGEKALALWHDLAPDDIVLPVVPGDIIPPYGFAALADVVVTQPDTALFYGDEDSVDSAGRYLEPELKPDWSPIFQQGRPYLGRAVYCRRSILGEHDHDAIVEWVCPENFESLFGVDEARIGHIRRILLTKRCQNHGPSECREGKSGPSARLVMQGSQPPVTIIIPTRDRADLLAEALSGIERTEYQAFDVLIVDNGSVEPKTHELFQQAASHLPVVVMVAAGSFNFSALCNRAAEAACGQILVFLNNDTKPLRPDWLQKLVRWAVRPDVGAVGAKLLYPDGRLQHGGVVLGLGGYAAHIESGADGASAGYLGGLTVSREVSAVTGACLAVAKEKFRAVGGFDAERFPVELGDIDLCLRLAARGCKTVLAADSLLMHRESATREKAKDLGVRYARERENFMAGWKDDIVDDPYFHPALSLNSLRTSLDG